MFDFYQRRKLRAFAGSPYTALVLVFLAILLISSVFTRYQIAADMKERRVAAEAEVSELRKQKEDLQAKVDYLSGDRGIEAELRRQFDVVLPGEQVVVIVDKAENGQGETGTATSTPESKAWYEFWR